MYLCMAQHSCKVTGVPEVLARILCDTCTHITLACSSSTPCAVSIHSLCIQICSPASHDAVVTLCKPKLSILICRAR